MYYTVKYKNSGDVYEGTTQQHGRMDTSGQTLRYYTSDAAEEIFLYIGHRTTADGYPEDQTGTENTYDEARLHRDTVARIATYLRNVAPDAAAELDDHRLALFVVESSASGRELGLTTERSQGFWSYMMLNSKGKIAKDETVRDYITSEPETGTPDDKVYNLMSELAEMGR
jgi:hypothetical protein